MPKYVQNPTPRPSFAQDFVPRCVREYLDNGAQKGSRNKSLHFAAAQCLNASVLQNDIHDLLLARAMRDGLSELEANKTINSAYAGTAKAPPTGFIPPGSAPLPRSAPPPAGAPPPPPKRFVPPSSSSRPFSLPIPLPLAGGFKLYLENNFKAGEGVSVSETVVTHKLGSLPDRSPGRGIVRSREDWLAKIALKPIEDYYPGEEGIFIRINPTKGPNDSDVTACRFGLFEADKDGSGSSIPLERQYAALVNSRLPCRAILYSGDKSIHGIVALDAPDRAEYDRRYALALTALEGHWIDGQNKNPGRYSRVPGVPRRLYNEQGDYIGIGRQELLALNVGEVTWADWEAKYCKDERQVEIERILRFRPVSDLSVIRPVQLVEGLLYVGTKLMFVAPSKSFKTWNLLNFLFCLANGIPYLGRKTIRTTVVHFDFELLEFDLWWRLSRIAAAYGLQGDPFENFHVVSLFGRLINGEEEINFADPVVRKVIIASLQEIKAGAFAIDPIYMTYGREDENSNSGRVLTTFDPICFQTGSTMIFNHHFAKGDPTTKNPFDRASGGGVFHRNVYTGIAFTPHRVPDAYTVNFSNRGFAPIDPFVVRWQLPFMVPDTSLDPDDLATAKTGKKKDSNTQDRILAALYGAEREGGLTAKQLAFVLQPLTIRTIQRHLKMLITKGELMHSALSPNPYQLSPRNADAWLKISP